MIIPFVKAQGAGNDFLFTQQRDLPAALSRDRLSELARAICDRHAGVGADGWYLMGGPEGDCLARIHLYNSDGSEAELSGNGTRCAAAILVDEGHNGSELRILTGSGPRTLRLVERGGLRFRFEMDMGRPAFQENELRFQLALADGPRMVTILDVGNPQCAVQVDSLEFDWKSAGAAIEGHPHFPRRTNVSFLSKVDDHTIAARFYERGAGPTLSSGTGAVGAGAAAILLGLVSSPVRVLTEAGPLDLRWGDGDSPSSPAAKVPIEGVSAAPAGAIFLTGPSEITARGEFFW
jgi:diaminopimelate epimerase